MSTSPQVKKHKPQRTCVACRQVKDKQELVRLARTSDNLVEVDINERKSGRGAYLCRSKECWETGLNSNRLEYSLRTVLTPENREQLIKYGRDNFE